MTATDTLFGTLDFLFDFTPGLVKKGVQRAIRVPTPKAKGSPFLSVRLWKQHKMRLLAKRAYHVEDETSFLDLEDTDKPFETRYCVQYHRAKKAGDHLDVRVLVKGRAISWAVPMKGKRAGMLRMPEPGERWLAVRQPDHTKAYMAFHGEIKEGLGAGTVELWSEGICDVLKIEDGHVHVRFLEGPAAGDYVFVDTSTATQPHQGLVIAKALALPDLWTKPRYTKKDLDHVESLAQEQPGSYVAETKVDGASVCLQIEHDRRGARLFSHRVSKRTGLLIEHTERVPHIRDGCALRDGEVQGDPVGAEAGGTRLRAEAWHPRGVNFLSGVLNSGIARARATQRQAGPIRLAVFDITHYRGRAVGDLPYRERRALYERVCRDLDSPYVQPVRQVASGFGRFYEQQVNLKKMPTDGIVIKDMELGHDEKPWVKVKPHDFGDCMVVGLTEGLGRHSGRLGALTVEAPNGSLVQVGTGFTDWERAWIWEHRADLLGDVARVAFHVRAGEQTNTGPRFDSWHPDKSEAGLKMYAEAMDASDPNLVYKLKSAAGWRRA